MRSRKKIGFQSPKIIDVAPRLVFFFGREPEFILKQLEEGKEENRHPRLEFFDFYAAWFKRTPNKIWT